MSKASQIIVLCEDKAQDVFVKRFLKKGWKIKAHRDVKVEPYPAGEGSGKKHVQDNVARLVRAYRSRSASTVLIVVHDADEKSVTQIRELLEDKIDSPRTTAEGIVFIIPKWHIETWLAYLDDADVDETDQQTYKKNYGARAKTKEAHAFIDKLANQCKNKDDIESLPNSLVEACKEFERIRDFLSG